MSSHLLAIGILIGAIALFRQLTGFLVGLGAFTFLLWEGGRAGGARTGRDPREGVAAAMASVLAAYLVLASDVSGIVLFGIWPLSCSRA